MNKDKRMKIILAARQIFEEKGYHEAKIAEIAKKAEVGKGTVYEYFESKQVLFEEMIMELIDIGLDLLEQELGETDDPIQKLNIIAKLEAEIMQNHGQLFSLILVRLPASSETLKQKFFMTRQRQLKQIEEIVMEGINKGIFKDGNPKHFALIFKGSMLQVNMQTGCEKENELPFDETLKDEIFNVLIDSIKS